MRAREILHVVLVAQLALVLAATQASAQAAPPDVIRTQDGGLYRGVILENVPNDHILILMPNGETRRIASADVVSTEAVAPTASIPTPEASTTTATGNAAPEQVVGAGSLRIAVTSTTPGLTLHGGVAGSNMARACFQHCELRLDPGNYVFSITDARGRSLPVRGNAMIDRDGDLEMSVTTVRRRRTIRIAVGLAIALSSFALWLHPDRCEDDDDVCIYKPAFLAGGSAILVTGATIFGLAFAINDHGTVVYRPR